jgi:hypothetical protein
LDERSDDQQDDGGSHESEHQGSVGAG